MNQFTELIIDEKEFDSEIYDDFGSICQVIYPGCNLFYIGVVDGAHKYTIDRKIDLDSFKKKAKECREDCKKKRKEVMDTVICQLVKINGEYYIKDGDKKIALFE